MQQLNELMSHPGAEAAFHMNDRGELIKHLIADGSKLNETALDLLAHMCVANIAIATMQARGWENSAGNKGFYPIEGFTLVGMDWSVVTNGCCGLVVASDNADYEGAYALLTKQGAEA